VAKGYTVKHWDDFETIGGSGDTTWRLARKSLGGTAFGFNIVEIPPGSQIPEHDHSGDNQEEVYAVLDGEGTFVAGGEEHPAPAGTFILLSPAVSRTVRNNSDAPVRVLLIGVPRDSGYKPMSWA
jgi:quercetin dioxygenase-like cupin family protein